MNAVRNSVKKSPKANAQVFWDALKALAVQKYGKAEVCFRTFCCPKDGLMSFVQFHEMCAALGLNFHTRTIRVFFKMPLREGDVCWSIQDYNGTLALTQIEKIKSALQEYSRGLARTASHVDSLIRYLAMHTGELNQRRALARFQRKITVQFCLELRKALHSWTMRRLQTTHVTTTDIDCESVLSVIENTTVIQAYEADFIENIFMRLDRNRSGRVPIADLLVTLLFLGSVCSRKDKSRMLFVVFDLDDKRCLTKEQLLTMYRTCTVHGVLARGDQLAWKADDLFGDELSLSKASRLYDYTLQRLAQQPEDDYCTWEDWWAAFGSNEMLLRELVPGTQSIEWVAYPPGTAQRSQATGAKKNEGRKVKHTSKSSMSRRASKVEVEQAAPSAAERFQEHAVNRIKHAVRGEWEEFKALQRPVSTATQSRNVDRLPAMNETRGLRVQPRQSDQGQGLGESQSLPNLHGTRRGFADRTRSMASVKSVKSDDEYELPPAAPMSSAAVRADAKRKVAEATAADRMAVEALAVPDMQRFGRAAMHRIRYSSQARVMSHHAHAEPPSPIREGISYECRICQERHSMLSPCCLTPTRG